MSPARRAPARGKRAFAGTWWGRAWVVALEDSALDAGRLARGRTYARAGAVGEITVTPGAITAPVQGSRPRPYRTAVRVPVLDDAAWDTLLDAIAARAAHVAALLDGEMPETLADAADAADVPVLPRPHEFDPHCSCPDWGYPCKHAAALCYAITAAVDADPFTLFHLRGRTKDRVLAGLRRRRSSTATGAAGADREAPPAGIPAAAAYARWARATAEAPAEVPAGAPADVPAGAPAEAPALAAQLAAIARRDPTLPEDPPPRSGLTADGLETLAADTAARAAQLLTGDPACLQLTRNQDAARLVTTHRTPEYFQALATGTGLHPLALARLTRAWRHGGAAGLIVAEQSWSPARNVMAHARTAVTEALGEMTADDGPTPEPRAWRNRLIIDAAGIQLRLSADDRWYPYVREDGDWWPCAPAAADAVDALSVAWEVAGERHRTPPG